MFLFDLPLEQLRSYTLPLAKEADFDAFWPRMLERSRNQPLEPSATPVAYPVPQVRLEKVSYAAFDGGRIVGWALSPAEPAPRPTLVFFHGYSGSKGAPWEYLMWALQGYTVLSFDVRGQSGESTDGADYPGGRTNGWLTSGILDPEKYYFVRAYVDTVRALDYAGTRADVDAGRIGVTGVSQGGGLSLAAAALDPRPKLCMPEVPAFGHFRRTLELTREAPWTDLTAYFQRRPQDIDQGFRTLSYVELNNLAERITCPLLVSVGMLDLLCPPSTIFTVYNRVRSEVKRIDTFAFNGHEAYLNRDEQVAWARRWLMDPA
jgi:cephalosporin-C deacetylase